MIYFFPTGLFFGIGFGVGDSFSSGLGFTVFCSFLFESETEAAFLLSVF
jgi:hypothetical protein